MNFRADIIIKTSLLTYAFLSVGKTYQFDAALTLCLAQLADHLDGVYLVRTAWVLKRANFAHVYRTYEERAYLSILSFFFARLQLGIFFGTRHEIDFGGLISKIAANVDGCRFVNNRRLLWKHFLLLLDQSIIFEDFSDL